MKNLILLFILLMSFQNMSSQEKFYSDGDVHLYLQTHKFKNYESDVEISFSGMGGILKLNGKRIAYNPEMYRKTSSIVIVKYYSLYDSNQTTTFILNGNSESLIDARNRREYLVVSEGQNDKTSEYSFSKIPTNRSGNKLAKEREKEPKKEPETAYEKLMKENPNYWNDMMKSSKGNKIIISPEEKREREANILLGKPAVGDFYQGGVVFWVDPSDNTHGLICAVENQNKGFGVQWYNGSDITTNATGTAIGMGSANTDAIISIQGATKTNYAAGLARAYNGGGYIDWFLPSKDELKQMELNKDWINTTSIANGGSKLHYQYWSSTEYLSKEAWCQYFSPGAQDKNSKSRSTTFSVRAVRAF
jgi:hypothetical protein